jgi:hypothetical protein
MISLSITVFVIVFVGCYITSLETKSKINLLVTKEPVDNINIWQQQIAMFASIGLCQERDRERERHLYAAIIPTGQPKGSCFTD